MRISRLYASSRPESRLTPDQQLIVYAAESGSRSEDALGELGVWAKEHLTTPR